MSKNSKRCWQPGCHSKGMKCIISAALIGEDEDQMERYCSEHAAENGYCYGCGIFCAGIESFDFSWHRGLCDNCADEVKANEAWDEMEAGMWEIDSYAENIGSVEK